jgi:hypothetical protein
VLYCSASARWSVSVMKSVVLLSPALGLKEGSCDALSPGWELTQALRELCLCSANFWAMWFIQCFQSVFAFGAHLMLFWCWMLVGSMQLCVSQSDSFPALRSMCSVVRLARHVSCIFGGLCVYTMMSCDLSHCQCPRTLTWQNVATVAYMPQTPQYGSMQFIRLRLFQ